MILFLMFGVFSTIMAQECVSDPSLLVKWDFTKGEACNGLSVNKFKHWKSDVPLMTGGNQYCPQINDGSGQAMIYEQGFGNTNDFKEVMCIAGFWKNGGNKYFRAPGYDHTSPTYNPDNLSGNIWIDYEFLPGQAGSLSTFNLDFIQTGYRDGGTVAFDSWGIVVNRNGIRVFETTLPITAANVNNPANPLEVTFPNTSEFRTDGLTDVKWEIGFAFVKRNKSARSGIDNLCIFGTKGPSGAEVQATPATCESGGTDGQLEIVGFSEGEKYDFNLGSTYTGTETYATATAIPADGIIANNLPLGTMGEDYSIRVFREDCYIDAVVVMPPVFCPYTCDFPTATITPNSASCVNEVLQDDASIVLTGITDMDRIGISAGQIYTGPDYAGATDLAGATTYTFDNTDGVAAGTCTEYYTLRFFNGSEDPELCIADRVVAISAVSCDGCQVICAELVGTDSEETNSSNDLGQGTACKLDEKVDLKLTKVVDQNTGTNCNTDGTGTEFVFTITLENIGDLAGQDVVIKDIFPDEMVVSNITTTDGSVLEGFGTIDWVLPTVAPAATETMVVTAAFIQPGSYSNCVEVTSVFPSNDPDDTNDSDCADVTITGQNLPSVVKAFSPEYARANVPIRLTISLINNESGPIALTEDMVDILPSTPGQMVIAPDPLLTTGLPGIIADAGDTQLTVPSGTVLQPGINKITVDVVAPVNGDYANIIAAGDLVTTACSNPAEALAEVFMSDDNVIAPMITKSFSSDMMSVGQTTMLTIVVENRNPENITLLADFIDEMPSGLTVTGTPTSTCGGASTFGETDRVGLSTGTVISGNSSCTIEVEVTATEAGSQCNRIIFNAIVVEVDLAGGGVPTSNEDVSEACVEVVSDPVFDLALRKTLAPGQLDTVNNGSVITYDITVFNQGTEEALDVQVTDYISTDLILVDDSNWEMSGSNAVLESPIASILPGASITIPIQFTIDPTFSGESITNFAEISSVGNTTPDKDSTPDTDPSNDKGGLVNSTSDDVIFGDATMPGGAPLDNRGLTDEDDADPEMVFFKLVLACAIEIDGTPGSCTPSSGNYYDLTGNITFEEEPSGGTIMISIDGVVVETLSSFTSPQAYTITGLPSDGATHTVVATFSEDPECMASFDYTAPEECFTPMTSSPCTTGSMGGSVFVDADADGQNNDGTSSVDLSGVEVLIFGCGEGGSSVLVESVLTDSDGNYSFSDPSITDGEDYRIEFTNLPSGLQLSVQGADNDGETVFTSTMSCDIDLGLLDPSLLCEDNPLMVTNCYVNGTMDGGVLVSWNYNDAGLISGGRPAPTYQANNNQIGTTWGLAYHKATESAFTSAFLKRHSRLIDGDADGFGDLGAIYNISMDGNPGNDNTPLWLDLDGAMDTDGNIISVGTIPNDAGRGIVGNGPNNDAEAFTKVGKVGIGDIDLNSSHDELWAVNVFDKTLLAITINSDMSPGAIRSFDIPTDQCNGSGTNNDSRPFAVKYFGGSVYVGVVCSGENTNDLNTMAAYVYRLDDDGTSTTFTEVLNFDLDYNRDSPDDNTGCNSFNNWLPWSDTWPSACCCGTRIVYPQPLLSDIEFNITTGEMLLGFIDRFGHQSGFNNYAPTGSTEFGSVSGGEVLKSTPDGDGTYTIETTIASGNEFYIDDFFDTGNGSGHDEIGLGGLAIIPGSTILVSTAYDPINGQGNQGVFVSGGTIKFNNATGAKINNQGYQIFNGDDAGTFGKAAGLGDLELLCTESIIQIGNYAWIDTNGDGVQDPCEEPLLGLTVKLYTKTETGNAELVATTTTSATGEYYFTNSSTSGETWESGFTEVEAGDYFIAFCGDSYDPSTGLVVLGEENFVLTTPDSGMGSNFDLNDSDVSEVTVTGVGDLPAICISVDETDFSFDAGFVSKPVVEIVDVDISCGPESEGGALFLTVEGGMEPFTYEWSEAAYDGMTEILNVPVGMYMVTVTDGTGCEVVVDAEITIETCEPNPCTDGELGGKVYNDNNANGEYDGVLEDGFQGVKVQIFACDENGLNTLIETVYTDVNGDYHFTDPAIVFDGNIYQIVFSNLPNDYISSSIGSGNGTDVQYISELGCNNNYGILNPDLACASPDFESSVVVGEELFSSGTLLGPGIAMITCGTIIDLPADERHTVGLVDIKGINTAGNRPEVNPNGYYHPSWNVDNIGNVFGIDYDTTGNIFVTASSHYSHIFGYVLGSNTSNFTRAIIQYGNLGGGANDIGAAGTIYKLDAVTGEASVFAQLPQQEYTFSHYACESNEAPLTRTTGPGLGNIVYDQKNNQFFVSNFEDGMIYRLDSQGGIINSFDPQTLGVFAQDNAAPGWAADAKPYGLAINADGSELFFGTHELNVSPGLYSVSLDSDGDFDGTETFHAIYEAEGDIGFVFAAEPGWVAISDLEFLPNGQIMIGLRTGCAGQYATSHNHGATFYIADEEGDGIYDNIVSNPDIQYPNDGTGNDDGYGGIGIWDKHDGTHDFLVSSSDTRFEEGPHGLILFPHDFTNGNSGFSLQPSAAIPYLPSFNVNDFKGVGGDVEVFSPCGDAPAQVGNFAWIDTNGNGIQDACESPLSDLTVKLYTKPSTGDPELVATTMTNSVGEYYFSDSTNIDQNWESDFASVELDSSYFVVFCGENYNPDGGSMSINGILFSNTIANEEMSLGGDMTDSDITNITVPTLGEFPGICITVTETNFTFDAGFIPKPDLALNQVIDPDFDLSDLSFGDVVKFKITVFNQSLKNVDSLEITDYVPNGYTFDENLAGNELWSSNGDNAEAILVSGLAPRAKDSICIYLTLEPSDDPLEWINIAEISAGYSNGEEIEDCDSPLNDNPDDNVGSEINTPADDFIDGNGTATEPDGVADTDQDNVDPATVPICDLALVNQIAELPTNVAVGDTIKYEVIVENQGTVPATNIDIKYTIPNGFDYVSANDGLDPEWSETTDCATSTIDETLGIGEKDTLCIYLTVENVSTDEVTEDSWTTFAEISAFEDPAEPGVDKTDIDSTPDSDPTNDPGGNPDDDTDDETGGDGSGDPDDPNEDSNPDLDEDDHDPAIIYVCDAATLVQTVTEDPIQYLDTVKFEIVVFNQGNGPITQVEMKDVLGEGLLFVNTSSNTAEGWTGDNDMIMTTVTKTLQPGESDTLCLELQLVDVIPYDEDAYLQTVEIQSFEDPADPGNPKEDIDSTPDDDPTNDSGGNPDDNTNDETDGEGTGDPTDPTEDMDPIEDEDDHDSELIKIFDLAIDKIVVDDKPYAPGEVVLFEMNVYNQGNVDAASYQLTDYLTDGFTFSATGNPGWAMVGDDIVYTSSAGITAGDTATVNLSLTVVIPAIVTGLSDWWNYVEISEVDDDNDPNNPAPIDADSTPDNDDGNDNDVEPDDAQDNEITENGLEGGDEDDHDPAAVTVGYDIALAKTVEPGPYSYGDTLTYTITLTNQGGLTMTNIAVYDSLPCGLEFLASENSDWSLTGHVATTVYAPQLASSESVDLELKVRVRRCNTPAYDNYYNVAEISDFDDEDGNEPTTDDIDSTPDSDPSNDGNPIDNAITDPMDEDDHDPENIEICDVALINTISEISSSPRVGDTVKYEVIVFNQGNHDVNSVTVDYNIPNGLTYLPVNDGLTPSWSNTGADDADITTIDVLTPGESDTICLYLLLENVPTNEVTEDSWTTIAEVTEYTNQDDEVKTTDADSTPDDDPTNDPGGNPDDDTDDEIDGEGTGDPNDPTDDMDPTKDEDDHDAAIIEICDAATIIYAEIPDEIRYYDTLKFNVMVANQGNGDITNIRLVDHLPDGLEFIETASNLAEGWEDSENIEGIEVLYDELLASGESDTICLELQVVPLHGEAMEDSWLQEVEISSFEDPANPGEPKEDIDSTPDEDPTNDPGGNPDDTTDNETDGEGTGDPENESEDMDPMQDEDDHDPIDIKVLDGALIMQIDSMPPVLPVVPGDELKFIVVVTNQGNTTLTDLEITNYLMDENLMLSDNKGNDNWDAESSTQNVYVLEEALLPGEIDTVCIYLEVIGGATSDIVTYSEISGSQETDSGDCYDIDSTPDDILENDEGGTPLTTEDDHVEDDGEDGDQDGITDEDDHDPAMLDVQDLALIVWSEHKEPVLEGNDVKFTIRVINQGNILNENVEIVDYIPAGFELSTNDSNDWIVDPTNSKKVTKVLSEAIDMGDTVETCIVLTVQDGVSAEDLINYAEIVSSTGPEGLDLNGLDVDSTPNDDDADDTGGQYEDMPDCSVDPIVINDDNNVEGAGVIGEDEDDHDPAWVHVFDLATIIYTDQTLPVIPGDEVKFVVELYNQGNVSAEDIDLLVHIPDGFGLSENDDNDWAVEGESVILTHEEVITPEDSSSICLLLEVLPDETLSELIPVVEITGAMDTLGNDQSRNDIDSDPNEDMMDDEGGEIFTDSDDELEGNGDEDEDDHDPAVPPVLDLAIKIVTEDDLPKVSGDLVKFVITVYNQGSLTPSEFSIENYVPEGLVFNESAQNLGWVSSGSTGASYTYTKELAPLTSDTLCIFLTMDVDANPKNVVDMVEISQVTDQFGVDVSLLDIDSEADASNENDLGNDIYSKEDNKIEENGRSGFDEDDHDQAFVLMCQGMACKGSINFSIDESCTGSLTPQMLLTGDVFPDFIYDITVKDENGNIVPNAFGIGDINKTFEVSISNTLCAGNSCWLPVTVEYKFNPSIECVPSDTLSCTQAFSEAIEPSVSANCVSTELLLLSEVVENLDCDTAFTSVMTRTYIARDIYGNTSDTCEQVIFLERTNLDNISPVQAFSIYNDNAISCSSGFATTSQGYPYPALSVTGAPRLEVEGGEFVDLYPFESNVICNGFAEFKDEILPGSTSCVTKILRTFTIGEWWCGGTNEREFIQLIEVVDFTGPEIACPIDMTVSTGSFECIASVSVPLPVASDACNDDLVYNLGTPVGDFENYNGESFELGVGVHTLQYAVYDACEQGSFCSFTVTVVDNADPIAICDQFTSVSLSLETTTYVTAESIDDGSFDECGPVTLSVARMDDPGFADFSGFGPRVDIDCADAGQSIMVGLLVTDAGGNTNMCMVSVDVVDKVEAQMVCPADMTVECNFAYDPLNLSAFFGEVEIFDNCPSANTIEEEIVGELNTCGSGVLTRQIRLLNAQGEETDNCAQTITFVSGDPLSLSDITPPTSPVEIDGCGIDALGMINITGPIIPAGICQQAATSVTSDTFPFTEEGACLKIIRTYKVIDWCISDGPGSVTEPFVFEQIIKVSNSEKPVFTEVFEDSTYCSFALDCGGRQIDGLTASASDDCTVDSELIKRYETRDASGAVVRFGLGHDASGVYDLGDYTVRFIAEDRCGNQEIAESTFTIMSCKQPVPYCLDGISTTLTAMDTDNDGTADSEQVMLTPSFFDAGSYHPCGLDVTLSFSSDINDTTAVFSCADTVGIVEVELWVTVIDGEGNPMFDMADFCIASLDVQDNESIELCNDGLKPVDIQGRIYTASDAELHEASVRLISAEMQLDMTDENGEYGFMDMPQGGSYSIAPLKDDDVLNGVSTLDLVMIQRHILGIADFENVYQYIAGDINHDERLTAADLSSLRKVILGVSNTYTNNTSWRFIDEAHEFEDATDPWTHEFAETYDITTLSEDMWVDFIAVKVGDINGNVEANVQAGIISETRSNESLILSLPDTEVEKDELYEIEVQTRASLDVRGLQVGFRLDGLELVDIKQGAMDIRPSDIFTDGSTVKMSYANAIGDQVSSEEVLYTMVVRATSDGRLSEKLSIEDNTLASEAYMGDDLEVGSVALEWRSMENVDPVALLLAGSVTPNPWRSQTEIHFELPRAGEVNLTVRDASGRVIHQMSGRFLAGEQSFSISKEDVNATGVLLYELQYGDQIENRKMIRIE
jgi:uncharacterized repeat protein (TIGR01451 family)